MAKLIKCFECGKQVSSDVKDCPHCGGNPLPINCVLCNSLEKWSNVKVFIGSYGIHSKCLEALLSREHIDRRQFSCPTCHKEHNYKEGNKACKDCGQPFTFYTCSLCNDPVEMRHSSRYNLTGYDGGMRYFHKSCHAALAPVKKMQKSKKEDHFATILVSAFVGVICGLIAGMAFGGFGGAIGGFLVGFLFTLNFNYNKG